jgi:hypothetical protein
MRNESRATDFRAMRCAIYWYFLGPTIPLVLFLRLTTVRTLLRQLQTLDLMADVKKSKFNVPKLDSFNELQSILMMGTSCTFH